MRCVGIERVPGVCGFNSKRCDYEPELEELVLGAVMCFNSKRCDYESALVSPNKPLRCFNSKRCDYEKLGGTVY